MKDDYMKVQKITLQVNGREVTFSKKELIAKLERLSELEKHLESNLPNQKSPEITAVQKKDAKKLEVAQTPTEGKVFVVDPNTINRKLFLEKRDDEHQEKTRKLILKAFAEVDGNPERYAKPFKTMIPEGNWNMPRQIFDIRYAAKFWGGYIADWVEQSLEWAQRIHNGEPWIAICNKSDTANYSRVSIWKDGDAHRIGGACKSEDKNISKRYPSEVGSYGYLEYSWIVDAAPNIVLPF